jgi:hypothetical protein
MTGEDKGWEFLADQDPDDICIKAQVNFDKASGIYTLRSYSWDISVSVKDRKIFSGDPASDLLLHKLGHFSRLSVLWYLVSAKDIPLSGNLINAFNIKGGHLFFRGTHVLPLDKLAEKHKADIKGFLARGLELGGERQLYGDASVRLCPLPRIPVTLILWEADDEFPPRAELLFDSTCDLQLPIDITWSIAMMSILIML